MVIYGVVKVILSAQIQVSRVSFAGREFLLCGCLDTSELAAVESIELEPGF